MTEFIAKTPEEMKAIAADIAMQAKAGDIFLLSGNLGAGKTTFAQGFIAALLDKPEPVTSPTFNLIQIYEGKNFPIYHCDFYRLKNEEEFLNLGLEDVFSSSVTLIEWPEMAGRYLPGDCSKIRIEVLGDNSRLIRL